MNWQKFHSISFLIWTLFLGVFIGWIVLQAFESCKEDACNGKLEQMFLASATPEGITEETLEPCVCDPVEFYLLGIVTAYSSSVDETDSDPFIMASGLPVYPGAAACPNFLPFGSRFEFQGKQFICEDRMSKEHRIEGHFDIWMESKEKAIKFGRKVGIIKILEIAEWPK